jgi:hypothetical protein
MLLENPLLPQMKTSNFDKAFDVEAGSALELIFVNPPLVRSAGARVNLFPFEAVEISTTATVSGAT